MDKIILAIAIGGAFGFVLDRVGATNPGLIINMLRLGRMHLAKTILLAIGLSSVLLFAGLLAGVIDPGHLSVKTAYLGVFIGGALLGLGFAVAGFCPGTGVTAAATGRLDAWFFVAGGLLGAAAYMFSYATVKSTGLLEKIAGGKATLGPISGTKYPYLFDAYPGELIGIAVGVLLILLALIVPNVIRGRGKSSPSDKDHRHAAGTAAAQSS